MKGVEIKNISMFPKIENYVKSNNTTEELNNVTFNVVTTLEPFVNYKRAGKDFNNLLDAFQYLESLNNLSGFDFDFQLSMKDNYYSILLINGIKNKDVFFLDDSHCGAISEI